VNQDDTDEPVGYDGFGAPLYAHQIGNEVLDLGWMPMRLIIPDDVELEDIKIDVLWQIPEPMTIETRHLDPDLLELIFGGPVVPLGARQIPAEGVE